MAVLEESLSMNQYAIDDAYEFSAPRFYDFLREETWEDIRKAELWFEDCRSYAPSPFVPRIKAIRSVQAQILCKFDEDEQLDQATGKSEAALNSELQADPVAVEPKDKVAPVEVKNSEIENISEIKDTCSQENESHETGKEKEVTSSVPVDVRELQITPAPSKKIGNKNLQSAKKIASLLKNPSAMKSRAQSQNSQVKSIKKPANGKRENNAKNITGTPNAAHDYPAIKKQKLDGGQSRQILTVNKPANLPHKTRFGAVSSSSKLCPSNAAKTCKEDRRMYVREPAVPFVSMAEMMNKFQSSTREITLPRGSSVSQSNTTGTAQRKSKLTLTRPKTPEFETSQRIRSTNIKSSAELEEEMMAKIPKFKAVPLNKKILQPPTITAIQRSVPQLPEFKEFHLETMSRANQKAETYTVASIESTQEQNHEWKPQLTAPKSPHLQTYLRARPSRVKSSAELEEEELKKIPQFKARPLNRKILESKGEIGLSNNMKKQVTIPQEFHFAIDKRIPPPTAVVNLFDKLSLVSEPHQEKLIPRNTTLDPFHLHTEERGAEKEKRKTEELMRKQLEDERARIPKALPYPYTTDYPEIPPKPEPKPCTKPEPFRLESVVKHEEEMQREMEERRRLEMDEAKMRIFKAQPILKEDPIPVQEVQRKPLTEVQVFNLQVNHRAAERAEFDKKVKEKEATYKRYREEAESARMMEDEKALKQMRRTLVPHAKPVPNFDNPFLPQKSSKVVTKAKSPRLHIARRNEKRRVVFPALAATASSAAASHMR